MTMIARPVALRACALAALLLAATVVLAGTSEDDNAIESFEVAPDGDFLEVPVRVDGREFMFVVDTGFTSNVLDASHKHLLTPTDKVVKVQGASGVKVFECAKCTLGRSAIPVKSRFLCADLSHLRDLGDEFNGILGMEFLRQFVLDIDFDAGRLTLLKSAPAGAGEKLPIEFSQQVPTISVRIPGVGDTPFILDTGLRSGIEGTLSEETFGLAERDGQLSGISSGSIMLVGGETACRRGELSEILVGKCRHAFRDFDAAATGNALGLGFLSRHRVVFDFPNSAVYLAPGSRFDQSFSENRSGIHVYKSKRGLFVGYVTPRSPGYAAGVRPGHRIVKIDGQPTGGMSLYTARRKLCDPRDGTRLETDPPIGAGTVALHNARRADAALPEDGVRGRK